MLDVVDARLGRLDILLYVSYLQLPIASNLGGTFPILSRNPNLSNKPSETQGNGSGS